jgi:C-terminal processing protease CtpA/Prc
MISRIVFVSLLVFSRGLFAQQTSRTIENLRAFAKLYGYVRFFHPSDEASAIDWDKFAVYGAGKVKNCKDSAELKRALEQLFLPIAPTVQIYFEGETTRQLSIPRDTTGLKAVAWQHYGFAGLEYINGYRSIRLNRISPGCAGWVSQVMSPLEFRGKEIKLSAWVKVRVKGADNAGQLYFGYGNSDNTANGVKDMGDSLITSDNWHRYEIVGKINPEADMFYFGCFLQGEGCLWVDDVQLSYLADNGEWLPIEIPNSGFENADFFLRPLSWFTLQLEYNYKVVEDTPPEGKRCLYVENKPDFRIFDDYPEPSEITKRELGSGLSCIVPLCLYSKDGKTVDNTNKKKYKALVNALKGIPDTLSANDEDTRLADVIIAWNVFEHFYPYFDIVNIDWDSRLSEGLGGALTDKNENDFYVSLVKMLREVKDDHFKVVPPIAVGWAGVPFLCDWIEGKVIVTMSRDSLIHVGDVVISIDGVPAAEEVSREEFFFSGTPQHLRCRALMRFGYGYRGTDADLVIERNTDTLQVRTKRNWTYDEKIMATDITRPNIDEVADDIFYVNIDRTNDQELSSNIQKLAQAKSLIFDLRGYPSNVYWNFIGHFIDSTVTAPRLYVPQIMYPDRERMTFDTTTKWVIQPQEPRFRGRIIFLTNAKAVSKSEVWMGIIEHYKLADIVGQPTAGTNGSVTTFALPGGFTVRFTGQLVLKHDGSQHHLVGIKPPVPVERTIEAVREGRDEYLEKAIELIDGK